MIEGGFFMEKYLLECGDCGEKLDAFISAKEMNEGPESGPECGTSDSFREVKQV